MLEKYGHGGDWQTAAEVAGVLENAVDFSANLNPLGPPWVVREVLDGGMEHIMRYPDPAARRFRRLWSERHKLPEETVWVTNGGAEGLQLVLRGLKPRRLLLLWPCFGEYEQLARLEGIPVRGFLARPEEGFVPAVDEVMKDVGEGDMVMLGSPNNPTSWQPPQPLLLLLMQEISRRGGWFVLDEAFLDFSFSEQELTLLPQVGENRHLIIVRSMTKMFSVPGLRLGYVAAHPDVLPAVRRLQVPWSVNGLALAAGERLLAEGEFVNQTRQWLCAERERFQEALSDLGEAITLFPGNAQTNFLLIRADGPSVRYLQQRLLHEGLIIRSCHTFRGLGDHFFRVAVRRREENDRLVTSLRQAVREWQN